MCINRKLTVKTLVQNFYHSNESEVWQPTSKKAQRPAACSDRYKGHSVIHDKEIMALM
jgi:hypothetical protein